MSDASASRPGLSRTSQQATRFAHGAVAAVMQLLIGHPIDKEEMCIPASLGELPPSRQIQMHLQVIGGEGISRFIWLRWELRAPEICHTDRGKDLHNVVLDPTDLAVVSNDWDPDCYPGAFRAYISLFHVEGLKRLLESAQACIYEHLRLDELKNGQHVELTLMVGTGGVTKKLNGCSRTGLGQVHLHEERPTD